jgi:1-acyl-sn-glycerol-3-phosphate acyltransferase
MSPPLINPGIKPASPLLVRGFSVIARRRLRQGFRALRIVGGERLQAQAGGPLLVYLNHPSWWDPLVCLAIARALLPRRTHYAPISAASLIEYPLFERLGMFPVQQDALRGVAQFLRGSQQVLHSGGVLWITAQGSFTDARVRPAALKSGLGALLHRLPQATVLPLAIEYTFWNERLPEALVSVGEPIGVSNGPSRSSEAWTKLLEGRLESLQDELAELAIQRDPKPFTTLLRGDQGTAGFYGWWQRLRGRGLQP